MPFIGTGRSTVASIVVNYPEMTQKLNEITLDLENQVRELAQREVRDDGENVQTLWKSYKGKVLRESKMFLNKRRSALDKAIEMWESRREALIAQEAEGDEDAAALLEEARTNLSNLYISKQERSTEAFNAKVLAVAERGTKFDYDAHKDRKPRDTIHRLKNPGSGPGSPTYQTSTKHMVELATKYHEDLQTEFHHNLSDEEHAEEMDDLLNMLEPQLNAQEADSLDRDVTEAEAAEAVMTTASGKAAGLDGVPVEIWKHLIKEHRIAAKSGTAVEKTKANLAWILQTLFNDIRKNGVTPGTEFAEGWMCPIYKKGDRSEISNYRPITVLNTDYKILTRLMSDRLSKVVHKLVHPDQAGFIKDRSIFDQTELIRLVLEVGESEDNQGAIVCLDQEKAYDKVRHDFLWATMEKFGLPESFTRTMQHLYADAKTSIILNGVKGRKYLITRGVRQGDPLSCLLFDLAIESLATAIRKSPLRGMAYDGIDKKIVCNLFADDTTVFLDRTDDFGVLMAILTRWCRVAGAKFNINKTMVIPLGKREYRERLRAGRKLNINSARIPGDIHIVEEGEPVRILGAWYGYDIDEEGIWRPIIDKIARVLERWAQDYPTIRGRKIGNNTMVGGFTQYAVQVQGMPNDVLMRTKKIMDDFIWAKGGEVKRNTVSVDVLQDNTEEGGLGVLDLEARNEAIEIVRLRTYLLPPDQRPLWCFLADRLLAKAAVKRYTNVEEEFLVNPFTQCWKVNVNSKSLPQCLKRMMRVAYKYDTKIVPTGLNKHVRDAMPYWYHAGNKDKLASKYNDKWGRCQRHIHGIVTTGEMLNHANGSSWGCRNRLDCKCGQCRREKRKGCKHPPQCRANARRKLQNIEDIWNPASAEYEEREDDLPEESIWSQAVRVAKPPSHPNLLVRIFTKRDSMNRLWPAGVPEDGDDDDLRAIAPEVHTDGSCHSNGTLNAVAGSGLWYGADDPRNESIRIERRLLQSNNTGEAIAALRAIQNHRQDDGVMIASDSQYTIDIITKHAKRWFDSGFAGVANVEVVSALIGEMILSENKSNVWVRKVKGHSGDTGNDGADALANAGARKNVPDVIDMSAGALARTAGASVNAMSQAVAYKLVKEQKRPKARDATKRMMDKVVAVAEEITGSRPTPAMVWERTRQRRQMTTTQKFSQFSWKAIHDAHKVGRYFQNMANAPDETRERGLCKQCIWDPVETLEHILCHCTASGQKQVWKLAKRLWRKTGLEWTVPSIGMILGANLAEAKGRDGKKLDGRSRLLQILLSESAYLIWVIRCEWKIGREQDETKQHTKEEIEARWRLAITKRLRMDWTLTSKLAYGKRALKWSLVERTWRSIHEQDDRRALRVDLFEAGVVVGRGGPRRPPGRNR
ncbi:hypothetical protein NMY22_g8737 [Coprinellus aureogranulatus]|nr:hypothetical protein NMY22_g8737 [Coprinellus aureogranulatus]